MVKIDCNYFKAFFRCKIKTTLKFIQYFEIGILMKATTHPMCTQYYNKACFLKPSKHYVPSGKNLELYFLILLS